MRFSAPIFDNAGSSGFKVHRQHTGTSHTYFSGSVFSVCRGHQLDCIRGRARYMYFLARMRYRGTHYRGTCMIRKRTPLGPCHGPMPGVLGAS